MPHTPSKNHPSSSSGSHLHLVKPPLSLRGSGRERVQQIAERCGGGRERHGTWLVCCPAHNDHDPSLVITPDDSKVLLYCRSQHCTAGAICTALGLTPRDLFDDGTDGPPPPRRPTRPAHLGPRIPEPPGGVTEDTIALQVALELIIEDCGLLDVEACQALFRRMGARPLLRLWIDQQLQRHHLNPARVWMIVEPTPAPASTTGGLRTSTVASRQGGAL